MSLTKDWNNKEFVLDQIQKDSWSLEFVSDELKDDQEVVLAAIKKNIYTLEFASEKLRDSEDIILEVMKNNNHVLGYTSKRLREDKQFLMKASKINYKQVNKYGSPPPNQKLQYKFEPLTNTQDRNLSDNLKILKEYVFPYISDYSGINDESLPEVISDLEKKCKYDYPVQIIIEEKIFYPEEDNIPPLYRKHKFNIKTKNIEITEVKILYFDITI